MSKFICRSWLCFSALYKNNVNKINQYGADIIHIDLEDSVPKDKKNGAREASKQYFAKRSNSDYLLALRINSLKTIDGISDLQFLVKINMLPDILILPKVESDRDIEIASEILSLVNPKKMYIFAIIETARGLKSIDRIVSSNYRPDGLIFGAADMMADLSLVSFSKIIIHIKSEIALAAVSENLIAIDSPCFHLKNNTLLEEEIIEAKELGYRGKIAIHPNQVEAINKYFSPTFDEISEIKNIVEIFKNEERSIIKLGDRMIGPPFLEWAKKNLTAVDRYK
jgi:citrate lyase beta subunit